MDSVITTVLILLIIATIYLIVVNKNAIVKLCICFLVILALGSMYLFNTTFKNYINAYCNPSKSHRFVIGDSADYLPLPPKTALKYRTSDQSAVYITKSTLDTLMIFFQNVADSGTLSRNDDDSATALTFDYHGKTFHVHFKKSSLELCIDIDEN